MLNFEDDRAQGRVRAAARRRAAMMRKGVARNAGEMLSVGELMLQLDFHYEGWRVLAKEAAAMEAERARAPACFGAPVSACFPQDREIWLRSDLHVAALNGDPDAARVFLRALGHAVLGAPGVRYDFARRAPLRGDDRGGFSECAVEAFAAEMLVPSLAAAAVRDAEALAAAYGAPVGLAEAQVAQAQQAHAHIKSSRH